MKESYLTVILWNDVPRVNIHKGIVLQLETQTDIVPLKPKVSSYSSIQETPMQELDEFNMDIVDNIVLQRESTSNVHTASSWKRQLQTRTLIGMYMR